MRLSESESIMWENSPWSSRLNEAALSQLREHMAHLPRSESGVVIENPPYAAWEPTEAVEGVIVNFNSYMGARSLAAAVRTKLASIDTSQSVELKRFVMLTSHELGHLNIPRLETKLPKPLLYNAYHAPTSSTIPRTISSIIDRVMEERFYIFQSSITYHLLDLVFKLIDKVVDYWNTVAAARLALRSLSGTFRQFLENALQFKPFHTPLRLFPNSIHPIGSAA
jgi:hypothetical protein